MIKFRSMIIGKKFRLRLLETLFLHFALISHRIKHAKYSSTREWNPEFIHSKGVATWMKSQVCIFLCASSVTLLLQGAVAGMCAFSNTARLVHRKVNDIIYWRGGGEGWNKRFLLNGTWEHKWNKEEKTRYWITSYVANDASSHPNQIWYGWYGLTIKDWITIYMYKRIWSWSELITLHFSSGCVISFSIWTFFFFFFRI